MGAGRSDSQWVSRAPGELRERVSARREWGTQRANPGAPAAQSLCLPVPGGPSAQWATTGAPEAFGGATSVQRGSGTRGANPGAHAARHLCSSTLRGPCAQWATTGAPDAHATRNQQGTRPAHARPTEYGSVGGGWPGQCVEKHGTWASCTRKHSKAGCGRPKDGGVWTAKTVKQPRNNQHNPNTPTIGRR